ncbi:hypothetical protein GALMADRAFT_248554 [Galerina marginata CBS 339.88]|uniref:DUF6533 domain-containing protein n=1 Tax=Galerina marginata (strain CBS 339.88) TaxID=685588 RepID=A0A067SY59_GALM3|nr:hypothetical protein GALMADRAFT_248554 [Galerina marginata CBS 339.88]
MVNGPLQTDLQIALRQSSGASLAVLLWEWAITFDDEVGLIWSKANYSWLKWIFFFARYFVLAVQLISRFLEVAISAQYDLYEGAIRVWYTGQVIVACIAVSALDLVLMARVYALYNQQRWIGALLVFCLASEVIITVIGLLLNLPGEFFEPSMLVTHLPASFAYLGIASVASQFIILIFTLRKYVRSPLSTVPLVRLMTRDGTFAFLMLTIFGTCVAVYTVCNIVYAVTGYAWLLSAVSCATCRLIINMQRIPTSHETRDTSTTIQFTTIFTDQIVIEDFLSSNHRRVSRLLNRHFE